MARATKQTTKPAPQETPDTPTRAVDDLNEALGKAQGIIGVIRDGAMVEDTHFDNEELESALHAVSDLLYEAHAAAQRLHEFRKEAV
jgi:hypothetical protein